MKYSIWPILGTIILIFLAQLAVPSGFVYAQGERCFPQTNQCISGRFREYWEQNGGLAVFGYPLGPARDERNADTGKTYLTQWFERNRLELHPENKPPYDVLLGRLGVDELRRHDLQWQEFMATQQEERCLWFAQTRQSLCDDAAPFKTYWQSHGTLDPALNAFDRSLALFGMPVSSPQPETNAAGDTVITQWFERARFEYHPTNPAEFQVLLGLLGVEGRNAPPTRTQSLPADAVWVQTLEKVRAISPSAPSVTLSKGQGLDQVAAVPDGSLVVYYQHAGLAQPGGKVWGVDAKTGKRRVLFEATGAIYGTSFSPDSSRLVVVVVRELENWELVEIDLRTDSIRTIRQGNEQSYVAPLAWTPAGILATRYSWGDAPPQDLLLIDPATSAMRVLRPGDHWGAAISDDGKRIAVTSGKIGFGGTEPEMSMTVIDTNTGRETVLISNAKQVLSLIGWSPDGARLAYLTYDSTQNATVNVVSPTGSARQSLTIAADSTAGWLMGTRWRDASTLVLLTGFEKESRLYHASLNAFTVAGLKQVGSVAGGMETTPRLIYVPKP